MSKFIFTPYLNALLTGPNCPNPRTMDYRFKTTLNGLVNEAWRAGKFVFTEDEIEAMIAEANAAIGQTDGLASLKLSYAKKEQWYVEVV